MPTFFAFGSRLFVIYGALVRIINLFASTSMIAAEVYAASMRHERIFYLYSLHLTILVAYCNVNDCHENCPLLFIPILSAFQTSKEDVKLDSKILSGSLLFDGYLRF